MGTWYVDEYTYTENFTPEFDAFIHAPAMMDQALGLQARSSVVGGRVHGHPNLESTSIGYQESPARMRAQDDVYRAAIGSGSDGLGFEEIFAKMPDVWKTTGGFHIIDADDAMLVEKGEAFVHKQFTDYMAKNACNPEDKWDDLCRSYLFKNLVNNIALGVVPAGVVAEPIRQLFGFPYEWHGAPIE